MARGHVVTRRHDRRGRFLQRQLSRGTARGLSPADAASARTTVAAAVVQVRGALAPFETLRAAFNLLRLAEPILRHLPVNLARPQHGLREIRPVRRIRPDLRLKGRSRHRPCTSGRRARERSAPPCGRHRTGRRARSSRLPSRRRTTTLAPMPPGAAVRVPRRGRNCGRRVTCSPSDSMRIVRARRKSNAVPSTGCTTPVGISSSSTGR